METQSIPLRYLPRFLALSRDVSPSADRTYGAQSTGRSNPSTTRSARDSEHPMVISRRFRVLFRRSLFGIGRGDLHTWLQSEFRGHSDDAPRAQCPHRSHRAEGHPRSRLSGTEDLRQSGGSCGIQVLPAGDDPGSSTICATGTTGGASFRRPRASPIGTRYADLLTLRLLASGM